MEKHEVIVNMINAKDVIQEVTSDTVIQENTIPRPEIVQQNADQTSQKPFLL